MGVSVKVFGGLAWAGEVVHCDFWLTGGCKLDAVRLRVASLFYCCHFASGGEAAVDDVATPDGGCGFIQTPTLLINKTRVPPFTILVSVASLCVPRHIIATNNPPQH